jgi:putative flippase GtrA
MSSGIGIALLYSLFAVLSTAMNIGAQMIFLQAYRGLHAIEASILFGTAVGLPLRYLLEKRYIFSFKSRNVAHDSRLFVLYSLMSVFTTGLFWGTEYAFHALFASDAMRYLGAVLGLGAGFYAKYQLDKKYVFVRRPCEVLA